jgi:hypothetical protein
MKRVVPPVCTRDLVKREQNLGIVTSIVTGGISYGVLLLCSYLGLDVVASNSISVVVATLLGYVSDIMLAKMCFHDFETLVERVVPIGAVRDRAVWLLRSMFTYSFIRVLMTVLVDMLVSAIAIRYIQSIMDSLGWFVSSPKARKIRDIVVASLVAFITFNLFSNRLRFHLAYRLDTKFNMDLIMYVWVTLLLCGYACFDNIV